MKLIDILVRELPKVGGWPEGVHNITQFRHGELCFNNFYDSCISANTGMQCEPHEDGDSSNWAFGVRVTREQYEYALAASKNVEWDDELPIGGVECEARYRYADDAEWFHFRCVRVDCGVAFGWTGNDPVPLSKGSYEFRPLRTEADKKREAACKQIYVAMEEVIQGDMAESIYDAIAAGKIPGVKLED